MATSTPPNTDTANAAPDMAREDLLMNLAAQLNAALNLAYDAGLPIEDLASIAFDLSDPNGAVVVTAVDSAGKEQSETISADDMANALPEELSEEQDDAAQDDSATA